MKSWWTKALTESLKNRIQRRNESCKWNLTARGWDTHNHNCCLCKVYKLDVFQTHVTYIRWQKWVTETGHIITVTGQTQSCPCLQLLLQGILSLFMITSECVLCVWLSHVEFTWEKTWKWRTLTQVNNPMEKTCAAENNWNHRQYVGRKKGGKKKKKGGSTWNSTINHLPWYNHTSWLGIKHQLTYLLTINHTGSPQDIGKK